MSDIRTALRTLALSAQMVEWFRAHYTPSDTGEYDAREELEGNFGDQLETFCDEGREEILDSVTMELEEAGDLEWAKICRDVHLLRAHDHEWGKGHVHRFEADIGKTTCGRKLEACPGDLEWGTADDITCKACLAIIARRTQP
jgi:hypothetical protein